MMNYPQPQSQPAMMMQAQPQRTVESERCCCCALECGVKVIAILSIVSGIFGIIRSGIGIRNPDSLAFDGTTGHSPDEHYANLVTFIFYLSSGILLLIGVTKRDTNFCYAGIGLHVLSFISSNVGNWINKNFDNFYVKSSAIIGFIIGLLVCVYIIYVIYTYIKLLNATRGQMPMTMGPMGTQYPPSQQQSFYQPAAPNANYSQNQINPGYPRPQPTYSQNQLNPQPSQPTE